MTHLQSVVATCQLSLLRFPHNPLIQHRLQQASRQLEQYLSSRAADIAFKAKLKVEGAREMGVPSLLSGLNSHIKASQVSAITLPSGRLTSNLGEITAHCTSFFSNLYGAPPQPARPSDFWHHLPPSSPPSALLLPLHAPFSLAEIDRAMASLAPGKTPGSDGLPGDFFRFYRALLGPVFHQLFAAELESFLAMSPLIHPPRLEPWVLLAEPLPFNRFLLKPDGQPFGGLKEELPLFTLQLRLGHLLTPTETGLRRLSRVEIFRQFPTARFPCSRRILTAIIEAVPLDWWEVLLPFQRPLGSLAAGDWTVPVSPPPLSPPQLLQVRFPLPGGLVVADSPVAPVTSSSAFLHEPFPQVPGSASWKMVAAVVAVNPDPLRPSYTSSMSVAQRRQSQRLSVG
ncbi:unnamed protein product [Closterium sp. NIES-64]|nr:unnamed protein product [Closterium sp. NIES-64]